jgi:hypothetical protein
MTDYQDGPPLAGPEDAHLIGGLERVRRTFRWKIDGLDAAGMNARIAASELSLGALTKHLAALEDYYFGHETTGAPLAAYWQEHGWDGSTNWELESAADDTPAQLYALYDDAVALARERLAAALADGGLDRLVAGTSRAGEPANLRKLVFDMYEEYARHLGHADLIRESVDGLTGEDPD